ncbi:MAG: helix-turn-helix domain-containing protein [Clostridia bacterium]|nr:helix-turn-helix domain-containing protein [Clostridia bacterium]
MQTNFLKLIHICKQLNSRNGINHFILASALTAILKSFFNIAIANYVTIDHLGRAFKRETGMTLTQYINKLRVEMTKDILQNTNRPIEHIPEVFGIKLKYLQQVFKRYAGMSMREYRSKRHYR